MISEQGCYLISREEQDRLVNTVLTPKGLNRKCVGRSARVLLSMIGIDAPSNIRCIVFEGEKEHPLISEELMMPILGLVRAKDFDDAVKRRYGWSMETVIRPISTPRTSITSPNTPERLIRPFW